MKVPANDRRRHNIFDFRISGEVRTSLAAKLDVKRIVLCGWGEPLLDKTTRGTLGDGGIACTREVADESQGYRECI